MGAAPKAVNQTLAIGAEEHSPVADPGEKHQWERR